MRKSRSTFPASQLGLRKLLLPPTGQRKRRERELGIWLRLEFTANSAVFARHSLRSCFIRRQSILALGRKLSCLCRRTADAANSPDKQRSSFRITETAKAITKMKGVSIGVDVDSGANSRTDDFEDLSREDEWIEKEQGSILGSLV